MSIRTLLLLAALSLASLALTACRPIQAPDAAAVAPAVLAPDESGLATVNDIEMYYAVYGEGEPVLLLHGGLGNADYFANQIPDLVAAGYQAIALDSRGHGRSTFSEQQIGYHLMASDVMAMMDYLGIDKASIVGWSDGGIIGLDIAISNPERLNKVFAYGANYNPGGVNPEVGNSARFNEYIEMAAGDYTRLSPTPDQFETFLGNIGNMWATEPNFTPEELQGITVPVMVIDGLEEEAILIPHAEEMAGLIPGAELVLMADIGHFAMWDKTAEFNAHMLEFLGK